MNKIFRISFIFWLLSLTSWASTDDDLGKYKREGARQLKALIAQNSWNEANGLSHQNQYVFSFLPRENNRNGQWIEERPGGILLAQSDFDELSTKLNTYNNGQASQVKLYVCLAGDWPIALKKKLDSTIEYTNDWKPYEKEDINKKITERFTSLVREIFNSALSGVDQSSLYAITRFEARYNGEKEDSPQYGFLKYFHVKKTVPDWEEINPNMSRIKKSTFKANLNTNIDNVIKAIKGENENIKIEEGSGKSFYDIHKNIASVSNEELETIANLINSLHGELYRGFVDNGFANMGKDELMFYDLGAYEEAKDYDDFKTTLENYIAEKTNIERDFDEILNNDESTQDELLEQLSYLTYAHCRSLTVEKRINTLKKLSQGPLNGKWLMGDGGEFSIIKLIRTTPKNQVSRLFSKLREDNLIGTLNYKVDDYFLGPDNYSRFIDELHKLFINKGGEGVDLNQIVENELILRWRVVENIVQGNDYSSYYSQGNLNVEITLVDYVFTLPEGVDVSEIKSSQEAASYLIRNSDSKKYSFDPFEPIGFVCEDKEAASIIPGAVVGETYIIPAFYFVWILNEQGNKENIEGLKDALTVVTLAFGVGEVVLAKNAIQLTLGLLDVGFTLADIYLDDELKEKIGATDNGKEFLKYWEVVSSVNDIASVSAILVKSNRALVKTWYKSKANIRNNISADDFAKIDRKVEIAHQELKKIGQQVDDVIGTTGIKLVDDFLITSPKVDNLLNADLPSGYEVVTRNNSKYIRRSNASNSNTPRLMVDETGTIVPYFKSPRLSSNGILRSKLKVANGGTIPDNHQAHHIVSDNIVKNSPIHQEAIKRGGIYDIDRPKNGKLLAETEEDFDAISEAYPTHYGSHPKYDKEIKDQIDNIIEENDIDILNLSRDNISDDQLKAIVDAIESRALNVLTNWQPSKLN